MLERSTRLAKLTNQSALLIKISVFTKLEDSFFRAIYLEISFAIHRFDVPFRNSFRKRHIRLLANETECTCTNKYKKAKKIGLPV